MKKNKKIFAFIYAFIFSIIFSLIFKWSQTGNPFRAETIMYGVVVFIDVVLLGGIGYVIFKKYSSKSIFELRKRLIRNFILFVILALIISLLLVSAGVYIFYMFKGFNTSNFLNHLFNVELVGAIKQFSIWILITSVFFFYIIWRQAIYRELKLSEENLKYRYRTLKMQVDPHFLFNSLNTLSELVHEDVKRVDEYIQQLSGIYRYVIENEENEFVVLEKEISFVQSYFEIQKERNGEKIFLNINITKIKDYKIIPVSLQLLIENALKHNSVSVESPLKINITNDDNYVIVSNNLQRRNIFESSTKTGLQNLKERIKLIMNKELMVSEENNNFIVKVPIIKIKNESSNS